jgi:aminomethyltransferase
MIEPGIPRPEHRLYHNDIEEGYITSGGFSPILKQGIAMGYLPPRLSKIGTQLMIKIRNKMSKAQITNLPFYDTAIYGARRKLVQSTS